MKPKSEQQRINATKHGHSLPTPNGSPTYDPQRTKHYLERVRMMAKAAREAKK